MNDDFETAKRKVLAPIFFEAGAALFDCQAFENAIAYFLFLLSRMGESALDPARCAAILDGEEKKTAGQLIVMLRNRVTLSEGLEEALTKALIARNRLIHWYLLENVELMMEVGQHERLVKEIGGLRSEVRRSQRQLAPFIKAFAETLDGISPDAWATEAKSKFLRAVREHQ